MPRCQIIGRAGAGSLIAEFLLTAVGVAYDIRFLSPAAASEPDFLALNPLRKIPVRKSCIKTLNIILDNLIRWFAPILSFTTEEIFKLIYKDKKSIHLEFFKKIPSKFSDEKLNTKWIELKKIREVCNSSIEEKRASKKIGSSLEADLKIEINEKSYGLVHISVEIYQ